MSGGLVDKVVAIHEALTGAKLPHALAWCVGSPQRLLDVNVFIAEADAKMLVGALPASVGLPRHRRTRARWSGAPRPLR